MGIGSSATDDCFDRLAGCDWPRNGPAFHAARSSILDSSRLADRHLAPDACRPSHHSRPARRHIAFYRLQILTAKERMFYTTGKRHIGGEIDYDLLPRYSHRSWWSRTG